MSDRLDEIARRARFGITNGRPLGVERGMELDASRAAIANAERPKQRRGEAIPLAADAGKRDGVKLNFVDWDAIKIEPVRWLMRERLPLAELTIVEGDGGLGKTTAMLDLAARLSRGQSMPDGTPSEASHVVVVAQEDRAEIIKARLLAANADLKLIHLLDSVGEDRHFFTLPTDSRALLESVTAHRAQFVVIDALFSHFDADINAHKAQDVRRALTPLSEVAHIRKAAVVGIRHWGKGARSAADRGMGSVDIRNVARSVLTVAKHPDDDGRIVVAVSKSNLGKPCRSLALTLESVEVPGDAGAPSVSVARVAWGDEVEISADQLANTGLPPVEDIADRDVADDFLREFLDGPKTAKEVHAAGERIGLKPRTLQRAAKRIGVVIERQGFGKGSIWSPPAEALIRDTEDHSRQPFVYDANGANVSRMAPMQTHGSAVGLQSRHVRDTFFTHVANGANEDSVANGVAVEKHRDGPEESLDDTRGEVL